MGYRDDFYVAENLIGYTGQVHKMPTVYFRKGNEFGHITQYHDAPQNNGREAVHAHAKYQIGNEMDNGTLRLIERIGPGKKGIIHRSRNAFVDTFDAEAKAVLLQSIWKWPEKKDISGMSRDDVYAIFDQVDLKKEMHAELKSKVRA